MPSRIPFARPALVILLCGLGVAASRPAGAQEPTVAAGHEALVDSLLGLMTLEEKLGQLAQYSARWNPDLRTPEATPEHVQLVREGRVGSFLSIYGAEHLAELQRIAVEESRLGIPLLFAQDVIHGFRTIFPVPLAEAASWDPEAVERAARIAAIEATGAGVHWTFAPMVDVARDPRWGRIVEGAGEDPYLGSVMARARVRGFEGEDLSDPTTLLATAKHYVGYGGAEGGRDYNTVDISERTLHEIYLPPFRAAVDEGVESIMAAFNEIGGTPMHANDALIEGLLREQWGWDGLLVSDYTGILELIEHGVAADSTEAGILALEAGVDVDMVSGIYGDKLVEAVRAGRLDEAEVDEAVRRVLRAKAALGLFEDPFRYTDPEQERAVTLTAEHRQAARELA
ncbi:MAG: glycoside hydrolase family 3 protein, partial [Gemmatimonadota bacterium]